MSPTGSLRARVVEVIIETEDAHSFVLEPVDGDQFDYRPGQFLTVRIPTSTQGWAARCYSLCSSPAVGEKARITVKRTVGGHGSNWMCDNVVEGTELEVLEPSGTFTPDSLDHDFVLFAAGSGITPVMSILKSGLHAGTGKVTLVYANRDEISVIFRDELVALGQQYPDRLQLIHWLESVQSLPTETALRALASPFVERHAFICGPGPFMDAVSSALGGLGMPRERVHVERFTSLATDPFAGTAVVLDDSGEASTVEVALDGETRSVRWPTKNTLLDVLLDAGMDAPFSCREGACSACACRLLEGEVRMERNEVLEQEDLDEGYILACQSIPLTERLTVSYDV